MAQIITAAMARTGHNSVECGKQRLEPLPPIPRHTDKTKESAMATIAEHLDLIAPATCSACNTPYKRTEQRWIDYASRNICKACGLDQSSPEASAILKQKSLHLYFKYKTKESKS